MSILFQNKCVIFTGHIEAEMLQYGFLFCLKTCMIIHELSEMIITVAFSEWLSELRKAVLEDTLEKIKKEGR